MSEDEQSGGEKGDPTMAEMEERLEARLLERVMQKVHEHLPHHDSSGTSTELPKRGQS